MVWNRMLSHKEIAEVVLSMGFEFLVGGVPRLRILGRAKQPRAELLGTAPAPSSDATEVPEHILATCLEDLETAEEKILKYKAMAMNLVKQRVKLLVEPSSENAFATMIADAEIGKVRGSESRRVIAIYDNKRCGEAMMAPRLRVPLFRKEHAQKVVRAFIQCRGSAELLDGDLMFFFDAGRHGNDRAFSGLFATEDNKRIAHEKRVFFLSSSEESVRLRRHVVEMLHVFSRSTLDMPEVKHPIYPGSSSGDLIGPINLERFQDRSWQVTEEEKRKMLGGFRIVVGGLSANAWESTKRTQFKRSELKRKPAGTADDNVLYEPFCYHGLPPARVPYLGITFTEQHMLHCNVQGVFAPMPCQTKKRPRAKKAPAPPNGEDDEHGVGSRPEALTPQAARALLSARASSGALGRR
ncbi:unnamed protein product, partial [Effrenium voratum]